MTWFLAGAAALSFGSTLYSGAAARSSAIRNANSASKAEGQAIVADRHNKTLQNAYGTAFSQMQLALQKRQLAGQSSQVSAAALAAQADVQTANAATSSIGATTDAVVSDINQKAQAAQQNIEDSWEMAQINYNNDLDTMVLNTDASAPNVRQNTYVGPSTGELFGGALVAGLTSFASGYAMQKMKLGAGTSAVPSTIKGLG